MEPEKGVEGIKKRFGIIGRDRELQMVLMAIKAGKHVLMEGPVGIGKTLLARSVADYLGRGFTRIDGDERFTERKLIGYWDPPVVINKGYVEEALIEGPLTRAALSGGVLFINELNRLSEAAQNALLPVMDEGVIAIPHLETLRAADDFVVIATQNPEESIGVTKLSEALKDRFVLVKLDYQSEDQEREIVGLRAGVDDEEIIEKCVKIARATREDPSVRRGASIRAAIDMACLAKAHGRRLTLEDWLQVALMTLSERIEVREDLRPNREKVVERIVKSVVEKEEAVERSFFPQRGPSGPR